MEAYAWIIVTYLILVLIMNTILIGFLEAHRNSKKVWLFVLIQPFGFLWFMWEVINYNLECRREWNKVCRVRKKYKGKWH